MQQLSLFDQIDQTNPTKMTCMYIKQILQNTERTGLVLNMYETSSYTTLGFEDKNADFRIKFGKKVSYISIPGTYGNLLKNTDISYTEEKTSPPWLRINLDSPADVLPLADVICAIYDKRFTEILPDSFDCCSHYMECSDAKECVQQIDDVKRYCKYRAKLKNGIIFYGKNRNID